MTSIVATRPVPAMVRQIPAHWVEAARALLGRPVVGKSLVCAAIATLCLWVLRWRARVARGTTAVKGVSTIVVDKVPQSCEEVAVENSILSIATIDQYDNNAADDHAVHGSPAPRLELSQTSDPATARSAGHAAVARSKTGTTGSGASDSDGEIDGDLPTPSTASLLARLQAPRRFKTAAWQPRTSARSSTQNSNEAQTVVEGQAQQQRAAAAAAKQRREEKRAESASNLSLSARQTLQPNCEVYSTSSGEWIAGTYVAADDVLPNTVRVQYRSATGASMQKLLKVGSPHLRKKSIQDLAATTSEAEQKDSANELAPKRLCLGEVTNARANTTASKQAEKAKRVRRGPRNGGGGYKRRYKPTG